MTAPLKVTLRNMGQSPALQREIEERAEKLQKLCPRLVRCEVLVEAPHKHQRSGRQFTARVDLHIPGAELVASNAHHEDAHAAAHHAFDAAKRQLEAFNERRREAAQSPREAGRDG